jgi:molybdopterin converting factor small subunit
MQVEVVLFATLRRFAPPDLKIGEARFFEVGPGTTLAQLRDSLNLPAEEVRVIMRNNRQAELEDIVADGDRVAYLPAIAGG